MKVGLPALRAADPGGAVPWQPVPAAACRARFCGSCARTCCGIRFVDAARLPPLAVVAFVPLGSSKLVGAMGFSGCSPASGAPGSL